MTIATNDEMCTGVILVCVSDILIPFVFEYKYGNFFLIKQTFEDKKLIYFYH